MALGDWDFTTGAAALTFGLDVTTPIVGSGSVRIGGAPGSSSNSKAGNLVLDGTSFTIGLIKGRIRTLYRCNFATDVSEVDNYRAVGGGITIMHNQVNISSTNSNFYSLQVIQGFNNPDLAKVILGKATANPLSTHAVGWDGSPSTGDVLSDTDGSFTFEEGDVIPIQLEWNYDLVQLGGIRLTASKGNVGDTDFSNLAPIYDIVDISSPHSTSVGEGIGMEVHVAALGDQFTSTEFGTFDQTGVFQLV